MFAPFFPINLLTMGNQCSGNSTNGNTRPPRAQTSSNSQVNPDLSSYEAACRLDTDLKTFDSALQERTSRVINSLATCVEVPSLSLDSIREVTGSLLDMNEEVVNVILECQRDIWKNKDLYELVQDYFETSLKTLDFCTALERCLKRARDTQLILQLALQKSEDEQREGLNGEEKSFSRTLQELRNFKSSGDPFTDEFFSSFQSVYRRQMLMLEKLQAKKKKLDKKLKSMKDWRKVSNVIFGVTFAAVLICSVVAAAISAPPVVAAVAAAAAVPLGSMGKWLDSIWKKWENEIKGQRELISTMQLGTIIAIKDMDSIRVLVDRLEIEIESLLQTSDFALREEGAVMIAIDEIKKKVGVFMHSIEDLGDQSDKCTRHIRMARTVILQSMLRQRSQ